MVLIVEQRFTECFVVVKAYLRQNWKDAQTADDPELYLLQAGSIVTAHKSRHWIEHAGYIV